MRDITEVMNAYRECSRNLWNVYFSGRKDIGGSLDVFGQIRQLLFDSLVLNELAEASPNPILKVVLKRSSMILIQRMPGPGQAGYWDQEKDLAVGPNDITLEFIDYFDFAQIPIQDFHYCRCKILSFSDRPDYEGREALLRASDVKVFYETS